MIDFEQALKNPGSAFESPEAIRKSDDLSREQKIKLLRQWEYDVLQLQVATEENMPPGDGDPSGLAAIRKALEALGEEGGAGPGPTKYG